jgi:hypothetical protein
MPATSATTASIVIQPIVSRSSRNARRISAVRSSGRLVGSTNDGGAQHSPAQSSASFSN